MERVEVGVYVPQLAMPWEGLVERARWVDELGFDSFWIMDHLYGPGLPALPSYEAWTAATALLTLTERVRVGHMVLCANFRHPVLLGKMATTLDVLSGGRFVLGLGSGSGPLEHDQAGIPWGTFAERTDRLEDTLEVVSRMFTGDPVTFEGRTLSVHDVPNQPPPVTPGGPPILVGGSGARTLELTARFAGMWNCPTYGLAGMAEAIGGLRRACERVGRDAGEIRLTNESVLVLAPSTDALDDALALAQRRYPGPGWGLDHGAVGTPDQVVDTLLRQVDLGITYFVFFVHDRATRPTLELLAEKVVPRLR